jgi:hypothetical protein
MCPILLFGLGDQLLISAARKNSQEIRWSAGIAFLCSAVSKIAVELFEEDVELGACPLAKGTFRNVPFQVFQFFL